MCVHVRTGDNPFVIHLLNANAQIRKQIDEPGNVLFCYTGGMNENTLTYESFCIGTYPFAPGQKICWRVPTTLRMRII